MIKSIRAKYSEIQDEKHSIFDLALNKVDIKLQKSGRERFEKFNGCIPSDFIQRMSPEQLKIFHTMVMNGEVNYKSFNQFLVKDAVGRIWGDKGVNGKSGSQSEVSSGQQRGLGSSSFGTGDGTETVYQSVGSSKYQDSRTGSSG
jgi:hypothetical protein